MLERLAERWRVHALDLRAHGGARRVPGHYRLGEYLPDVAAFIDGIAAALAVASSWRAPTARRRRTATRSSRGAVWRSSPDIVANAGGVVASWFESLSDHHATFHDDGELKRQMLARLDRALEGMRRRALDERLTLRRQISV